MLDEHALVDAAGAATPLPPVQLVKVDDPATIVRASSRVVVLVGSGDGVVDAAAAGLLHGDEALVYAADRTPHSDAPSLVVLTDSNRDRAHHWRSSQDVTGFTESGGAGGDVLLPDSADQRLPVFGKDPQAGEQTIATLDGGLVVKASGYGEPFAYRPEQRPAMAVDGDPDTAWVVSDRADPVGQYITASSTGGSLTLLQPQHTDANRMITSVRVTTAAGGSVDATLDARSLSAPGQHIALPDHSAATITITSVGPRAGGTDTGPSAVGFADLGLGTHTEVVRTPLLSSLATPVPAATPFDVVLTRQRVDPLDRWRSDPEPTMQRSFQTPARSGPYSVTVTLHRDDRAADSVLDALDGSAGAVANDRLTGAPSARGIFATDGDPATAWTSPFVHPVGSSLVLDLTAPLTRFTLQQPTDQQHSLITGLHLAVGSTGVDATVTPPDGDGVSSVVLPSALPAGTMTMTVTALNARTTVDRRYGESTTLPVSIRELSGEGIPHTTQATPAAATGCRTDLLTLDGSPLGVMVTTGDLGELAAGKDVQVTSCDGGPTLAAGDHRLATSYGLATGIDVDRVLLASSGRATAESVASQPTVSVTRTRTTRTATVSACPQGCWLIMGEGYNTGWTARTASGSLGAPHQIAGGFNGWWLQPNSKPTTVTMDWTPQSTVTWAVLLSLLAVAGCIVLAVWGGMKVLVPVGFSPPPPTLSRAAWAPIGTRPALFTAIALVVVAALVATPAMALLALLPAIAVVATRRPRIAGPIGMLLVAAVAARVEQRQLAHRFFASAAWPGFFERLHWPAMLAVVLLLAGALVTTRD
jgi:arabinofuranan 3-O-arabinosyltransferase